MHEQQDFSFVKEDILFGAAKFAIEGDTSYVLPGQKIFDNLADHKHHTPIKRKFLQKEKRVKNSGMDHSNLLQRILG